MKKILASILVLTMLVCCMSISAFAEGAPASLTIENVTVEAGKEAAFPVTVKVTGDFAAVKMELSIASNLTGAKITSIEQGMWTLNNTSAFESNPANGQTVWGNKVNVDIAKKGEGNICTYYVSVPADAINGDYTITLNNYDFCNVNEEGKVVTLHGIATADTATLTVVGGKDAPAHEHAAVGEWKNDANGHWNICECGEKIDEGAHVYTDDADKTCDTCGYERHVHEAGSKWENDANGHWNVCSCGEKLNAAAHVYADDADKTCDICGYERHLHVAGTEYGSDDNNHWNTCECGEKVNVEAHVYTDDADKDCDICGRERHIHVAGTEFGSDKDNHWNTCECGEKVNVEAHVYADDEDTTCDTCGYERTIGEDKEDDKDDDKEEDKKDDTTDTGDNTNLYIYMALCLFAAAAIVVTSYELKKTRG